MNENENNFGFEGSESWMMLALLAMAASMNNPEPPSDIPKCCYPHPIDDGRGFMQADKITLDEFTIERLRAAAMNRKEAEKLRLEMLRDAARAEEPDDYRDLYGRSWGV